MKNENRTGDVLLLLLVLAFAVVVVDERWLRTLVAVVPALILAQKAMGGRGGGGETKVGVADRRSDLDTRDSIDELLRLIREFYLTCHLMGTGGMNPDVALERVGEQEKELNSLLARVTDRARTALKTVS
jgi:hypothetical protein